MQDVVIETVLGLRSIPHQVLQDKVSSELQSIRSYYTPRRNTLQDYFKELNLKSVLTQPDFAWESDITSSILFQKTIFAYTYLRSLLATSFNNSFVSITSLKYPELASFYSKLFSYIVENGDLFTALDKAIFYALVSGKFVVRVSSDYVVDMFNNVEYKVLVEAIHPLDTAFSRFGDTIVIDKYIDINKAYSLSKLWDYFNIEQLKPYQLSEDYFRKGLVKISEVYTRLVDGDEVFPYMKFTMLNDTYLVKIEEIKDLDNQSPVILADFYGEDINISYVDLLWKYYKEDTRFFRKLIDRALLSTAFAFEVNDAVVDNEIEIRPFSVIHKRGAEDGIRPVQMGVFDPNIFPIRQAIQNEAQNISGLTEFLMGLPTSKGRPTAKEILIKTAQSQQLVSTLIQRFENVFVKKVILKLITAYIQHYNKNLIQLLNLNQEEAVAVDNLFGKDIIENKPIGYNLVKALYTNTIVKVNGLTSQVNAQTELQSLFELLQTSAQLNLTPFLNIPNIFTTIFQRLGINLDYVRIPTQEEYIAMLQQLITRVENVQKPDQQEQGL